MEYVSLETATLLSNILFLSALLGTITCFYIADKYGRKKIIRFSCISSGILLLLNIVLIWKDSMLTFYIRVVTFCLIAFIFDSMSGPVTWMIFADYLPVKFMSICVIFYQFCIFLSGSLYPLFQNFFGIYGFYIILGSI